MKKRFIIIVLVSLWATLMYSCKVVDPCPAYGQVEIQQQIEEV